VTAVVHVFTGGAYSAPSNAKAPQVVLQWQILTVQAHVSPEGLELLAIVLLHDGTELGHAPLVHQVLHARLLPVISPACVNEQHSASTAQAYKSSYRTKDARTLHSCAKDADTYKADRSRDVRAQRD